MEIVPWTIDRHSGAAPFRRLLVALFACMSVTLATATAAHADGAMRLDCDADASGIQNVCALKSGATFDTRVRVTQPPSGGYYGFQARVTWTAANLRYLPTSKPANEALWDGCTIAARSFDQTTGSVLFGCAPFPMLDEGSTFTGDVLALSFRCEADGATALTLVPGTGSGTQFLGKDNNAIVPSTTGAQMQCGESGPGPGSGPPTPPPNTAITAGPRGKTTDRTPRFRFTSTASPASFQCKLDSRRYARCRSLHTTRRLALGRHRLRVRAIDAAGQVDPTPTSRSFRVCKRYKKKGKRLLRCKAPRKVRSKLASRR
ncbi:MAG: hypothetical protein WD336_10525 [Trueperaceae bacterium]